MKNETQHKETIKTDGYLFTVYQESKNKWYVNAETHDGFFIYKWSTAKTRKALLATIDAFVN